MSKGKGGWWINRAPEYEANGEKHTSYGPYQTRKEAEEIKQGLLKAIKDNPELFGDKHTWRTTSGHSGH